MIKSAFTVGITGVVCGVEATVTDLTARASVVIPRFNQSAERETGVRSLLSIRHQGMPIEKGRYDVKITGGNAIVQGTTSLDVAVAMAILNETTDRFACERLAGCVIVGELAINGRLRPVRGVSCMAEAATADGIETMIVCPENAAEAAAFHGRVLTASTLSEVLAWVRGDDSACVPAADVSPTDTWRPGSPPDFKDVRGQKLGTRAMEVAAAGGHNVVLIGGPGAGKTMLARRLTSILPPMTDAEARVVTKIASASGLNVGGGMVRQRPFRAPHHSTTTAGLIGSMSSCRPGEMSLAHHGVIFLDEVTEFAASTLESAFSALLSGEHTSHSQHYGQASLPTRPQVVASTNPCPCGRGDDTLVRCRCSSADISRYRQRLLTMHGFSNQMDIWVPLNQAKMDGEPSRPSAEIAVGVAAAQTKAMNRQGHLNADLTTPLAADRVARTIADLADSNDVLAAHRLEAEALCRRWQT